jgi:hypothetical protein
MRPPIEAGLSVRRLYRQGPVGKATAKSAANIMANAKHNAIAFMSLRIGASFQKLANPDKVPA